jgi:glutamyl-Q tRNA(Asp) synthetase
VSITRFAPSPSGPLHLGHALAALVAWDEARGNGGGFLLRIEDIDSTRNRPQWETAIEDDLRWLGLVWPQPVRRQSEHLAEYSAALDTLRSLGLVYPCFCTRTEIQREIAASANAPHGPEGPLYPGTCRRLAESERARRMAEGKPYAWRLDVAAAAASAGPLVWRDRTHGEFLAAPAFLGDVVIARKEIGTSYHLAVVIDDAAQGVTLVTRGEDLLPCTHLHRLLQHCLALPVPEWKHHRLVRDANGNRLAKRDGALSLQALRQAGATPEQIRQRLGFS